MKACSCFSQAQAKLPDHTRLRARESAERAQVSGETAGGCGSECGEREGGGADQRDVSTLCMGLAGAEGVADLLLSKKRWAPLSTALLFWLGDGEGGGGGVGVAFLFVGASSSASVSSMRGMWGSESSIRNSGWVIKLWIELRDSGFSSPS